MWREVRAAVGVALMAGFAVASCGTEDPVGVVRQAACGPEVRFSESFLGGPDQNRERFAATAIGRIVDDFFTAGAGVATNAEYRDAEGFSPVSDSLVLGYRGGTVSAFFLVEDGEVAGWGPCDPVVVEG